jgi:hypothetical protein
MRLKRQKKYDYNDQIWFYSLFTKFKEILREIDHEKAVRKKEIFVEKNDGLFKRRIAQYFC